MGCWKMSKMEFQVPEEAEKFTKQKWEQFFDTPCSKWQYEARES